MQALLSELADIAGASFKGDADCVIHAVNTLSDAQPGEITFLSNERYRANLEDTRASAVILSEQYAEDCPVKNIIISDNPYLSYALIAQYLYPSEWRVAEGIHPSAIVDDSAKIADSACIGALAVIGKNVELAAGVSIGAGCIIGDNCSIAENTVLAARVTLYSDIKIGQRCIVHSGVVIGGDGFGFANDHGAWVKIPQTGSVVIGNDVEIGANTTIDRGAIKNTFIADGVKLDNLIMVAHNVSIGKNTAIAGCSGIAGSTKIGAGCTFGGHAGIVGHIDIADNVHVSGMTVISKSIKEPGHYTGIMPAMQHSLWTRNMVRLKQLDDFNKRIKALEKKLENQDSG